MKNLVCPVCSLPLQTTESGKSLQCENRHLFDIAKQGYINLLLSQNKKSKHPGDSPQMVQARTEFLNKGYYESVSEELEHLVLDTLAKYNTSAIRTYCDLGCGEGYYTERLNQKLGESQQLITTGIDISNPAIKAACKRDKSIQWLVASAANIPLASGTQDLVSGLFFHFDHSEIARILKPKGFFVLVNTGPNHLIELRNEVYDTVKSEQEKQIATQTEELTHIGTKRFRQDITVNSADDLMKLLAMTPHYWRAKPEKKDALAKLSKLDLSIDIQFDIFVKNT